MRFVSKTSQKNQKISCAVIYFVKTRGARSIIGSFGSQLVSGDYHEDGESVVMEMTNGNGVRSAMFFASLFFPEHFLQ